ncbi:MAG: ATPase [Acidobacteriota bacterium]|nr:ATPase [Acidobacteriota bacterium]
MSPHDTTSPCFLAIDAGGTKTDYLLADATRELARVRTGSIKLLNTSPGIAEANFASALEQLHQLSGIPPSRFTGTCIGTSGYSVPLVANWIRQQHSLRAAGELLLCGDEEIALDAAFRGGRGVLSLAGTGSNTVGRTQAGELTRAGGWGPVLADEGSGHWIGLQAVRSVFRGVDESRSSALLEHIQRHWSLASLEDLIQLGNATPPPPFAELTPVVLACAQAGDPIAAEVLTLAGQELARLVTLVIRRMESLEPTPPGALALPTVALAGSILQNVAPVRDALLLALQHTWPRITVLPDAVDPIQGALWRARTALS